MSTQNKTDLKTKIVDAFKHFENKLNGDSQSVVHNSRKNAFDNFVLNGFPTMKHENWKYDNLSFLRRIDFDLDIKEEPNEIPAEIVNNADFHELDAYLIVLVNGKLDPKLSNYETHGHFQINPLEDVLHRDPVKEYFGKIVDLKDHAFANINTAFAKHGLFIYVKKGFIPEKPIHILNITDVRDKDIFTNTRKLIISEDNCELTLFESNLTIGENNGLTNNVNELVLGNNAKVDYYKIQNDGDNSYIVDTTKASQQRDSNFSKTTISLSGSFVRNDLQSVQYGSNCETNYNGFFYVNDKNLIDNHTFVDHAAADCTSNEDYKGILDDRGHGVFNGKILVRKDSQRIDAYQSNKNILLSDWAKINTKPELEIYADDVKCSHGATSGALEKEQLFYLISRGVSPEKAESLLLNAFAGQIVNNIKLETVREIISNKIEKHLDAG